MGFFVRGRVFKLLRAGCAQHAQFNFRKPANIGMFPA